MKELTQAVTKLRVEIKSEKSNSQVVEERVMSFEKIKDNEMNELYKQLEYKN